MFVKTYNVCTVWTLIFAVLNFRGLRFLGRRRRPYIVFRNRFLCGFMFVYRMAGNFGGEFILADWRF